MLIVCHIYARLFIEFNIVSGLILFKEKNVRIYNGLTGVTGAGRFATSERCFEIARGAAEAWRARGEPGRRAK